VFESFSENDTLALAASLATSNKTFTEAQIEALVGNLPENYSVPIGNLTEIYSINLFLKFYLKIANSQDATIIRDLLLATNDSKVTNSIPASLFSSLPINISGIPLNNIPTAYVYIFFMLSVIY